MKKSASFEKIIAIPLDKPSKWVYTGSNDTARVLRADALGTLFALLTKRKETILMSKVPEMFGSMVFNDKKMQERLPKSTYKALKRTVQNGEPLDLSVANVVANAMKDWAVEMGCTHYTHWFQPMTGVTAEKHDSFIFRQGAD